LAKTRQAIGAHCTLQVPLSALQSAFLSSVVSVYLLQHYTLQCFDLPNQKLTYKTKVNDKERLKAAFSNAISALQAVVQITDSIASGVG